MRGWELILTKQENGLENEFNAEVTQGCSGVEARRTALEEDLGRRKVIKREVKKGCFGVAVTTREGPGCPSPASQDCSQSIRNIAEIDCPAPQRVALL
jgi:hypothetical protein